MKCHYEILAVSLDAEIAEIKAAYRKLALKWHPDKNIDNEEEAKEQFQLVQQAYEVLSDPQERAWYDRHREQILRGSNSEFKDNSLDVFQYFTTTCFKGYNDEEKGFYTVYRTVFDEIIKEDMEFMDDKEEFCEIPRFGDSKSDYDTIVGPFYAYWMTYYTWKSYVWLDPYDIKETRGDRRVGKLIEKENKKVRQKAKKERNDEIRNLVAFVRKRDKRVQENMKRMETKRQENRQKHEALKKQKQIERKTELLSESSKQAEWTKFDNVQTELEEIEKNLAQQFGDEFSETDEDSINNWYCEACCKSFMAEKAFANHELSKKHKENLAILIKLNGLDELSEESALSQIEDDELDISEEKSLEEDVVSEEVAKKDKKKKKKSKNVMKTPEEDPYLQNSTLISKADNSDDDFDFISNNKSNKKNAKKNTRNAKTSEVSNATVTNGIEEAVISDPPQKKEPVCIKKAKKKTAKNKETETTIDTSHCCVTCNARFPSKNKLFDHLKKTGHKVYLGTSTNTNKAKKNK